MILTLNVNEDFFMGDTYYFAGFVEGNLRRAYEIENKRIHIDGTSKKDCIDNAIKYMRKYYEGDCSSYIKFKHKIELIKERIADE
jgi:hypothetical protein